MRISSELEENETKGKKRRRSIEVNIIIFTINNNDQNMKLFRYLDNGADMVQNDMVKIRKSKSVIQLNIRSLLSLFHSLTLVRSSIFWMLSCIEIARVCRMEPPKAMLSSGVQTAWIHPAITFCIWNNLLVSSFSLVNQRTLRWNERDRTSFMNSFAMSRCCPLDRPAIKKCKTTNLTRRHYEWVPCLQFNSHASERNRLWQFTGRIEIISLFHQLTYPRDNQRNPSLYRSISRI